MAKDIDLTAQRWLDLIFADRNKQYGAYVLREESGRRHLKSLLIVAIAGMALVFLPKIIKSVIPEPALAPEVTEVIMTDITTEVPEEDQIKQIENVPPPPQLKETVQFTPPVIKKDEEVTNELISQQELTENKADISVKTVEGVKEGGVDIADLQDHKVVVQDDKPQIFSHVEVMPSFPGGDKAMMQWLYDNIQYPIIAQEQGIQGRVTIRFVVGPDGSVGSAEVLRSLDPSCDKEALRVIRKMPKWIPGKQNGQAVSVYYTLPVWFKLQN
ncbi:MAG: energy transducer TonB [Dysgonamonadaceae bacterium]|jgi:protein TonB|nr:energy transducer TonB [Dysgonamonadaceae bacterium]